MVVEEPRLKNCLQRRGKGWGKRLEKGKGIRVWGSVAGGGYWEGDRGRFSRRGGGVEC